MEAIITHNEEKNIPVITIHALNEDEQSQIELLTHCKNFTVVLECEPTKTLSILQADVFEANRENARQ